METSLISILWSKRRNSGGRKGSETEPVMRKEITLWCYILVDLKALSLAVDWPQRDFWLVRAGTGTLCPRTPSRRPWCPNTRWTSAATPSTSAPSRGREYTGTALVEDKIDIFSNYHLLDTIWYSFPYCRLLSSWSRTTQPTTPMLKSFKIWATCLTKWGILWTLRSWQKSCNKKEFLWRWNSSSRIEKVISTIYKFSSLENINEIYEFIRDQQNSRIRQLCQEKCGSKVS